MWHKWADSMSVYVGSKQKKPDHKMIFTSRNEHFLLKVVNY